VVFATLLTVFIALSIITPVYATAPTIPPRLRSLDKKHLRIRLLPPNSGPIIFGEGNSTYVCHGWATGPGDEISDHPKWSEMNSTQKKEFLKTASFNLTINGNPVKLRRFKWYNHSSDQMYIYFYAVFSPYYFTSPNSYDFEGFWYVEFDGVPYTYSSTKTIEPSS
jgi:hypothetical protein